MVFPKACSVLIACTCVYQKGQAHDERSDSRLFRLSAHDRINGKGGRMIRLFIPGLRVSSLKHNDGVIKNLYRGMKGALIKG